MAQILYVLGLIPKKFDTSLYSDGFLSSLNSLNDLVFKLLDSLDVIATRPKDVL